MISPKHLRLLWLSALRLGEYKQGRNRLRNSDNEFCCLGVMCDIFQKNQIPEFDEDGNEKEKEYWRVAVGNHKHFVFDDEYVTTMPDYIWSSLQLPPRNIFFAFLNDTSLLNFSEIAYKLEEYFEEYPASI